MLTDPFLSLPIHAPHDDNPQQGFKYKHSLSGSSDGISTVPLVKKQNLRINPTEMQRFFRNLSRSASNEYNPNIMAKNAAADQGAKQSSSTPSAGDRDDLTSSASRFIIHPWSAPSNSSCSSSRSASHASQSNARISSVNKKNRQKNDKAVEVLNNYSVVIARFRTQTDCAKYLQATPEAVSYHCSKKGGGVCNGLVIRPCDHANEFGLYDGAEEARPKKRPQLKPDTVAILKQWILSPEHMHNPYPSPNETKMLMQKTGLDKNQIKHWFNNARKRILKPILGKKKTAEPGKRQVVQEKRKAEPEPPTKRTSKKAKVESSPEPVNSGSSGTASPAELPLSQFGSMFGSERAGAGIVNTVPLGDSIAMGMMTAGSPMPFGLSQGGLSLAAMGMRGNPFDNSSDFSRSQGIQGNSFVDSSFPPWQEESEPSPVVFKQQVASMAMKEANIAFKNMEDAYAMAKEIMTILSSSGSSTNIEDDPRVIAATARAKKLHSVALFKLKVSKRASEEAEKAFEMMQG